MSYSFQSERVIARPVTTADTSEIEAVYAGNRELLILLDRENEPSALARRFVDHQNLPSRPRPRACTT
jgi:hypothetical protein